MSRHRARFVGGVGLALAAVILLLVYLRSEPRRMAAGNDVPATDTPSARATPAVPAALQDVEVESTRDVAAVEPSVDPIPATVAEIIPIESTYSVELHGQVIVLDPDGRSLPPQDGSFTLTLWRESSGDSLGVAVRAGQWRVKLDESADIRAIRVSELAFGDLRPTLLQPGGSIPIPKSRELEIRAQVPRGVQLRVLDAASGADLSGVEFVKALGFPQERAVHPGADYQSRILGRDLSSPIAMQPFHRAISGTRNGSVLVGASGYAWALVALDYLRGGDFVVALERGGDLDLAIQGVGNTANLQLRLRAKEVEAPCCEKTLREDGVISFVGLAPGTYTARAELGDWFNAPIVLGESTLIVSPGTRVSAALVVSAPPRIDRADITGVVFIASEWYAKSPLLVMEKLETPLDGSDEHRTFNGQAIDSAREGFSAFRWQRRKVETGEYEFGTFDPPFRVVIEVPHGGADFELVVPAPAELAVFVVDDATGEEVMTDSLHWNPRRPEGVDGGVLENAIRDEPNHRWIVRAPECEIELGLRSWDYLPYDAKVDLRSGVREHTIRLLPASGIVLKMRDGDTPVAFPPEWYARLTTVSGNGRQSMTQPGEFGQKLMVSEPGTYSIEIPKLSGYLPVSLQTIEVFAGRFTEHVVQLEREHR